MEQVREILYEVFLGLFSARILQPVDAETIALGIEAAKDEEYRIQVQELVEKQRLAVTYPDTVVYHNGKPRFRYDARQPDVVLPPPKCFF
jgi:hypothetical protein